MFYRKITNKKGIKYTIDYVNALKKNVEDAVKKGETLEQVKASVTMKEFSAAAKGVNGLIADNRTKLDGTFTNLDNATANFLNFLIH